MEICEEEAPETALEEKIEDDDFYEELVIADVSDEDATTAADSRPPSPAQSILDMDSPPTSPQWLLTSADIGGPPESTHPCLEDLENDEDILPEEMFDLGESITQD